LAAKKSVNRLVFSNFDRFVFASLYRLAPGILNDQHKIGGLVDIEPLHVAAYIEALGKDFEKPTVKLATNPAHAVRGPKHVVKRGKTPVLTSDQARLLLESIDTSTLVGLRDRALIGVMTCAFARIGAVVAMRVEILPTASAGGSASTKKAASGTRYRRIISWKLSLTSTSRPPALAMMPRAPSSARRLAAHAPDRRLLHDPAPRGRNRF
jgi:hypothetical protein